MSCKNCRDFSGTNCTEIVPSSCVSWQGDKVDELEICVNDSLTYVGNIVLAKIKDLLKGKGIILSDLTLSDCEYVSDLLGAEEKNLLNVLDIYKQAICALKEDVASSTNTINDFASVAGYTLGCIGTNDPCGDALTFKSLIQAIITKVCSLNTQLSGVAESLLEIVEESAGNFLVAGAVKSAGGNGISYTGSGATGKVVIKALVPPSAPILYVGSLASFDEAGIGLPNTAYEGWYLCNGSNGTPNRTTLPQNEAGTLQYIIRFN